MNVPENISNFRQARDRVMLEEDSFSRLDDSEDSIFYKRDRFVDHLDATAMKTAESIIGQLIVEEEPVILDLMASINSHIPDSIQPKEVIGLGLNENEMRANRMLERWVIQNLNENRKLPFNDETFDVVLNTLSIQYLKYPFEIMEEIARVLKPGGMSLVLFSNRSFLTKEVKIWRDMMEQERLHLVRIYFEYTKKFDLPGTVISMGKPRPRDDKFTYMGLPSDPVFAVYANKWDTEVQPTRPKVILPEDRKLPAGELARRIAKISDTHECPHCGDHMRTWAVTENPNTTYENDLWVCINDACPYLVRGYKTLFDQGVPAQSYRIVYNPRSDSVVPIPVPNLHAIKDELID